MEYDNVAVAQDYVPVTCGVLGMGALFDKIADGMAPERAVAMFIKGLARNVHTFAGGDEKIYLSGGLCENRLFVSSFPCEVVLLGRYVQIEGLKSYLAVDRLDLAVSN